MYCIVLDVELADKNVIKELGDWEFSLMSKFRNTHFVLQKTTNPQNKRFGEQETCTKLCGSVVV